MLGITDSYIYPDIECIKSDRNLHERFALRILYNRIGQFLCYCFYIEKKTQINDEITESRMRLNRQKTER